MARRWAAERTFHQGRPSSLRYLYDAFDPDAATGAGEKGHLGGQSLFHLAHALWKRRPAADPTPTPALATEVVRLLDRDSNDRIEWPEFRGFLVEGAALTKAQREALQVVSPARQFSLQLLDNVVDLNSSLMERALRDLYEEHDTDASGTMDQAELLAWMRQVHAETASQAPVPSTDLAAQVVAFLDDDKNGTLEPAEWLAWLRKGQRLLLEGDGQDRYGEGTRKQESLISFLDMVMLMAAQRTQAMVEGIRDEYFATLKHEEEKKAGADDAATAADGMLREEAEDERMQTEALARQQTAAHQHLEERLRRRSHHEADLAVVKTANLGGDLATATPEAHAHSAPLQPAIAARAVAREGQPELEGTAEEIADRAFAAEEADKAAEKKKVELKRQASHSHLEDRLRARRESRAHAGPGGGGGGDAAAQKIPGASATPAPAPTDAPSAVAESRRSAPMWGASTNVQVAPRPGLQATLSVRDRAKRAWEDPDEVSLAVHQLHDAKEAGQQRKFHQTPGFYLMLLVCLGIMGAAGYYVHQYISDRY